MSEAFPLDTNVPPELTRPATDTHVRAWGASHPPLHLSVASLGELRRGISLLVPGKLRTEAEHRFEHLLMPLFAHRILSVTQAVAKHRDLLGAECQRKGKALELADNLIAASALQHKLTRNVKHFATLGLTLLNPQHPN